jgi:hypothetical protein
MDIRISIVEVHTVAKTISPGTIAAAVEAATVEVLETLGFDVVRVASVEVSR